jgi:probable F420-dependent oxidoreductase
MMLDVSRIGLSTPGLLLQPGAHSPWEIAASFEEIARVVQAADRLGFHHVTCAEHVGVPASQAPRRGARYFEALAAFGYFAAVTTRIRFATSVLVLGYHHPLALAKQYGTLDLISGGRTILGLGVGSLKEEFDVLGLGGAEFAERGVRGDDALRALRAALGRREPEYHGRYYDFAGLIVDPCAVQAHLPLWIGGRSARSLRRAVELGDGWTPFGLEVEDIATLMMQARSSPAWAARTEPLEIVLSTSTGIDPLGAREDTARRLRGLQTAGASLVQARISADSAAHYVEQLECLAEFDR